MLQCTDLSKSYGSRQLFSNVTFSMVRGERLGLIGRNGCGKSTLFRMITGEEETDTGSISTPRNYRCGHLPQKLVFEQPNIVDEVCLGLPLELRDQRYKAEILLSGLGFSEAEMELPASQFSGGFQIRIVLAQVLVSEPNLLLLDEPTNYLDILSARWLTEFLRNWKNELIVISHDRDFLDNVTTHSMLIHRGGARKISGSTNKIYEDVALQEEVYERTRINEEKKRKEVEVFINRFRAKATKAAAVQSRIKALERMGEKEELQEEYSLDFKFTESAPFYGKQLLEAKDLSFAYEASKPLLQNLNLVVGKNDRIGVIGRNGKGKSTLLRLLASELNPDLGSVALHANARLGYFGQTNIARLSAESSIEDEILSANPALHRTKVRAICGTMMFAGDEALKKIKVLSGGEKSRVLLGKLLAQPTNLLFLDEPTNHLDMQSIEALIESIAEYQGAIIIVTHSEHILRSFATRLVVFQGECPQVYEGSYDEFLQSVGWDDEQEGKPTRSGNPPSDRNKNKSQDPKRAKKRIQQIENQICELEARIENLNHQLSTDGLSLDKLTEITSAIAQASQDIEEKFEELGQISKE